MPDVRNKRLKETGEPRVWIRPFSFALGVHMDDDWRAHVVPCVGSGLCCLKARCWVGTQLHGPGDKCPSLVWKDGRYWCGEVLRDESLKQPLSIDAGCCMSLFNELRDERFKSMTTPQRDEYKTKLVSLRRSSEK